MTQSQYSFRARSSFGLLTAFFGIVILVCLTSLDLSLEGLQIVWQFLFILGSVIIFTLVVRGHIFHPFVLIGGSYLLLLAFGSVFFSFFRDRPLNTYAANLIGLGFFSLFIGFFAFYKFWNAPEFVRLPKKEVTNEQLLYFIAILGLLSTIYMFLSYGGIPMFAANPNEAKVNFLAGNGVFNLFFKGMPVFAMALLYFRHQMNQSLWVAHLYCIMMIIFILGAGYRSTMVISLGEYIVLYLLLKGKKLPLWSIFTAGIMVLMFITIIGSYRRGKTDSNGALDELDIILNARPVMVELISRNFTEYDLQHGSLYLNDFKRILPGTQVNANVDLKFLLFQNAEAMPEIAGVTPSIIGEAYMNFGKPGVFWVPLALGMFSALLYFLFLKKGNFFWTVLFITYAFGIAGAIQSGLGLKIIHLTQFWFWVLVIGVLIDKEMLQFRLRTNSL
jgi:oligosaccharide repeat unit polymerase